MAHYLDFLKQVHETLEPRGYLEIGVRNGDSLKLASCPAIGIDPAYNIPGLDNRKLLQTYGNAILYSDTSDGFFAVQDDLAPSRFEHFDVDLAFIDGMHLIENVLSDFINIERHSNERTVVIFDDVLPYNQAIAAREQPPGDWTGDVWKIIPILECFRPDLAMWSVDTSPTGALVVTGLDAESPGARFLSDHYADIVEGVCCLGSVSDAVPDYILDRRDSWTVHDILLALRNL